MGETIVHAANPFTKREDGTYNGYCNPDGNVYGTYLHGIFDTTETTAYLVQQLLRQKGLENPVPFLDLQQRKEQQYDMLADTLRKHLNIKQIYKIINEWGQTHETT